jgi:O-antigen/teichoic acid export membrane protein
VTAEVATAASETNGAPTGRHRARKPGDPGGGTERSLGSRVAAATRWSLLNTVVIRVGNFALGVVLARYFLGPGEWGLYAVGLLVLNVLLSANEMGVSLAVVRWEGDVRRFAPTVLTLSFANSVLLYALLFVSPPRSAPTTRSGWCGCCVSPSSSTASPASRTA